MFIVRAFGPKQVFKFITSTTVCGLFIYLFIYNSLTVFFGPFDSVSYFWMMSQRMWAKIASAFCLDLARLVFSLFIAK